jgi:hypothetical protein
MTAARLPSRLCRSGKALHQRLSMRVRAASNPSRPIAFDPGSGCLYTSKSVKLLLRPFWPGHKNEIARILRLGDFEGGAIFQHDHIATLPIAA